MLPATLAQEVKKQVRHYLEATFPMRKPEMEEALARFFNDPENGIFKGPWLQLKRPFRLANSNGKQFFDLHVPFSPFKHQFESWRRLTSKNNQPQSTIVTTGTGSGKTECFLYPLLDHCLREYEVGRKKGIKAIVLYPMNALASDQAGRFAEEILRSDQLSYKLNLNGKIVRKAKIRVGLYTGRMQPGKEDKESDTDSTYREVQIIPHEKTGGKEVYVAITNREALKENPPDILLTNYKMLDYLLMRPKDKEIWQENSDPELLKYLVLDELHTYDGAQGADVACLIRRLKERLAIPKGKLCVVGTSATIAGGSDGDETTDDPINRLCAFASTLFEEPINNDAIILEDRFSIREITRPMVEIKHFPSAANCQAKEKETAPDYAQRMAPLFSAL